jgi:hypothetical protein
MARIDRFPLSENTIYRQYAQLVKESKKYFTYNPSPEYTGSL